MAEYETVLDFWFGTLGADGTADAAHAQHWWKRDAEFDALILQRFGALHDAIARGQREHWQQSARGRLAYVVVLDEFSRNLFRDDARAFAHDAQALRAAVAAIDRGEDRKLACDERSFVYMPLMHSEDLTQQERCVTLFTAFRDELAGEQRKRMDGVVDYAQRHRDIVRRFGRFPHRNSVLGRTPTGEESEFLTQPGSSF